MATSSLAKWANELKWEDVPDSVRKAAQRSLYNYLGCAIGGSHHPTVSKAHQALESLFGPSTSTLLGHHGSQTQKIDAQHAALLNGISSHVHDYDDTHLATIIHPVGPVASATLAFAQLNGQVVSGQQLLLALIAGIEASCKLGLAVWPSHYDIGWHITSTTGSIGAAVAIAKLANLSQEQTAHAIGIAATQVTGLREMFGSDTKSFHVGRAAQNGLLAAQMASKGFTSSLEAIEAKRGWANVVVGPEGKPQLDRYLSPDSEDGLSRVWEVERNTFKPFPCGIVCHPAIDASIQIHREMKEQNISVKDIESVKMQVHPLVIELTSKRQPKDGLEGKFSVFHGAAVGLIYGKAGPAEYDDQVVASSAELRDKIDATSSDEIASDAAKVVVQLRDGSELEKFVEHAVGSLNVPMTDEQLTEKFVDQCSLVLGRDGATRASALAWSIGDAPDSREVIEQL
ncbi:uncharacterized protein MYCFIDRAFT_152572 [Pseudocercospora fijiensis CIRAD86]|uniref:MmgE/PrpD family protein n=1 Tax=Pseudocercospora fijiensis (strain CIRAD86) TaxID=383855 RepID=M3B4Q2_PSEFD|nr:uncharacterized protein MYCFIDRAFT_152572 [Pseudocercospora fijiensis CIRAD86]EME84353.1 hypothetical protein MYCFIDRAFT_152572 [Pseudocercospora fijiensis CIRAD86]